MSEIPEGFKGGFVIYELTNEFKDTRHKFIKAKEAISPDLIEAARKYKVALDELIRDFEWEEDILSKAQPLPSSSHEIQTERRKYVQEVLGWAGAERDSLGRYLGSDQEIPTEP